MAQMKTPGVYIQEKNAFSTSVVEAATAIPAFIGITEKAVNGSESLANKPWKITSMTEFVQYFGGAPKPVFNLSIATDSNDALYCKEIVEGQYFKVAKPTALYTLYYNMIMFFANGGGTCYIVSVGTYKKGEISNANIKLALDSLKKIREVTLIVVPEAVNTAKETCKNIQTDVIMHCGEMQNRFAIFDVYPKEKDEDPMSQQIEEFQTAIGSNYLSYGAAYYPYLNTSVISDKDIDGTVLRWETAPKLESVFGENSKLQKYLDDCFKIEEGKEITDTARNIAHSALLINWDEYKNAANKVKVYLNLLPPSAAMAGIYAMVDNTRGVWKAPANLSLNYVNSPTETISDLEQEELNMPMNGKAINAIRTFPGEGIKVWGARTLDGNSQDWRYINVRRTMLFIEDSVKNAAKAYVFEPNVSNTWLNMKSMIGSFLNGVWKRGGLAGSVPEDAYSVQVGLGETMTQDDVLNGIMRITVLVAIARPAEFIEITFQQQVQKS